MENIVSILKIGFDHLEGIMGFVSVLIALKVYSDSKQEKIQSSHEKRIEIYMELYHNWDEIWGKITQAPEKNKDLFRKNLQDIADENTRFYIMNAISLLSRVFYYYSETNQDIRKSEWHETVKYVFSKNLFQSAFRKNEYRFSKKFKEYLSEIKTDSSEQNIMDLDFKDKNIKKLVNRIKQSGKL